MTQSLKKEWRRLLLFVLAGVLALPYPSFSHDATPTPNPTPTSTFSTSSITDLQKQKQQLEKKIKTDEAAKKKKQEEQVKLNTQITDLNKQIVGIERKIVETQESITATEEAIKVKEAEIVQKEAELAKEKDDQAETLRVIYETAGATGLEVFFAAGSLSEVLVYQDYLDALEGRIETTIARITQIRDELQVAKTELERQRAELADLEKQQQAYRRALAGQRQEKDRLLTDAKTVEAKLAAQIAEAQKIYADVNHELTKLMEAARRRAAQRAAGQIPKGVSNVGFQYPTAFLYFSTYFGGRTPFQSFHTGIDLVNYAGTPVVAAADGVVTYLGSVSYGYGIYVIVSHNERFSTVYAHFMGFGEGLAVGQKVSRGDFLGYMGTTGWSTGPHLHFEIREYGVPVDPLEYLP